MSSIFSPLELEALYAELWKEMFNEDIEADEEPYERATVLEEFVRRVNAGIKPKEFSLEPDGPHGPEASEDLHNEDATEVEQKKQKQEGLRTLKEWNTAGRWIIKGSKNRGFRDGTNEALFAYEQTRPKQERVVVNSRQQPPQGKYDDLEDDIPF